MNFDDIHQFFQDPPRTPLAAEQAVCYLLSVLLDKDSYGTELIIQLQEETPQWNLSETVFYQAIKFLTDEGWIESKEVNRRGRGRPRRMFKLRYEYREEPKQLAELWLAQSKRELIEKAPTRAVGYP